MSKKAYKKYKHKSRFLELGDRLTREVVVDALEPVVQSRFGSGAEISSITTSHLAKCVFTCELTITPPAGSATESWIVVAKTFPDRERLERAYELLEAFWQSNFSGKNSTDGVFVPEPYALHLPSNFMFMELIPGTSLRKLIKKDVEQAPEYMRLFAKALAKMQQCNVAVSGTISLAEEYQKRETQYRQLKAAYPHLEEAIDGIIRRSIRWEEQTEFTPALVHGDYNLGQLHIAGSQCWLLDFGNLRTGDPAWDVANVLSLSLLTGEKEGVEHPQRLLEAFQAEYFTHMDGSIVRRVPFYQAHYFLNRCSKYLRTDEAERVALIEGMIQTAQELVRSGTPGGVSLPQIKTTPTGKTIEGPFPPALDTALDETYMRKALAEMLNAGGGLASLRITQMERRIVRYELELRQNGATTSRVLIGKVYNEPAQLAFSQQMVDYLWAHGFSDAASDGVMIPAPLGSLAEICTLFMEEARGEVLRALLKKQSARPQQVRQYARAMMKLHRCQMDTGRDQGGAERLAACDPSPAEMARAYPELAPDIQRVVDAVQELEAVVNAHPRVLIHGDFHPGQVHVNAQKLWLLDIDNLKNGDPAFDLAKVFGFFKRMEKKKKLAAYMSEMRQHFLEEYFQETDFAVARRVPFYEALISLKRASKCLRVQDEAGWEEKMQSLIGQAVACIQVMEDLPARLDFGAVLEIYRRSPGTV